MRMPDLIAKKRDGKTLDRAELSYIIDGYLSGRVPDYQVSALLMAICFQGMTEQETIDFTEIMADSGHHLELSAISGVKLDKHSTGGVGDKTSMVVLPLAAACGVKIAKLSGRGLGHTGGTVDKLESIEGFNCNLTQQDFLTQADEIGLALAAQSGYLVPADKKLYALRDVTATVDSIPLIASSVMAKKLASGADAIVLDVKCGSGAFMKTREEAEELAKLLVKIGEAHDRPTSAFVTMMDRPLGRAVGNAIEVNEAKETLETKGPEEFTDLCIQLAAEMVLLSRYRSGEKTTRAEAVEEVKAALESGSALKRFKEWIERQGGNSQFLDEEKGLPLGAYKQDFLAEKSGYLRFIDTQAIGLAGMDLGAGRATLDDSIDQGAGLYFHILSGEYTQAGQVIVTLYSSDESRFEAARGRLARGIAIEDQAAVPVPLILERFSPAGIASDS